ncbi:hypothetical protein GIB67_013416 [Kingdonia uniflora]|uniref:Protein DETOXIFICATION n=1 Tax=Kingdonia uniflora TaxID=39325 RepID=A0A7J7LQZ2_9MAGN|nr:hypothetical protein GIB67_013416 [Kingdonia uniflora]
MNDASVEEVVRHRQGKFIMMKVLTAMKENDELKFMAYDLILNLKTCANKVRNLDEGLVQKVLSCLQGIRRFSKKSSQDTPKQAKKLNAETMDVNSSSSPLLLSSNSNSNGKEKEQGISCSLWKDVWAETKMIWNIAAPAILTSIFQYSLAFLTQTLLGMGSALETLCGQAYGAGKLDMLGIYMQRSWVILLFTVLLILPVYIFSSLLLKLLGQSAEIADLAGKLSIWMIPQLFAYALNFPMQKFLQAQSKVFAMMWISFGVLVFHSFLSWLCIIKLDMGLLGATLTLNLSWWLMVLGQLAYILSGSFKESWTGFSWLAFADLSGFLRLSFASAVMLCLEYWIYMVLIILVGLLKNPEIQVDAASICMNVEGWLFMVPLGFTAAIRLALACVAVGAGWQALVAYVNVACYYLVGLSAAVILGFIFNLGLEVKLAEKRLSTWGGQAGDPSSE